MITQVVQSSQNLNRAKNMPRGGEDLVSKAKLGGDHQSLELKETFESTREWGFPFSHNLRGWCLWREERGTICGKGPIERGGGRMGEGNFRKRPNFLIPKKGEQLVGQGTVMHIPNPRG